MANATQIGGVNIVAPIGTAAAPTPLKYLKPLGQAKPAPTPRLFRNVRPRTESESFWSSEKIAEMRQLT